jgi:hypothetical protein
MNLGLWPAFKKAEGFSKQILPERVVLPEYGKK